jgi:hypothetical protein
LAVSNATGMFRQAALWFRQDYQSPSRLLLLPQHRARAWFFQMLFYAVSEISGGRRLFTEILSKTISKDETLLTITRSLCSGLFIFTLVIPNTDLKHD